MILLQTGFHLSHIMRRSAAIIFAVAFFGLSFPAYAQSSNVESAGALHLAYVITGDSAVDAISRDGLEKLIRVLTRRTSIEPKGVIGVNPESDELAFFPLLYWPISASAPALSSEAVRRVQYYLDHGGTILFDTRDGAAGPRSANGNALRRITANLNIQPLIEMPEDHVLTKTFYLLTGTPGLYEDGTMWVEEESADGRDGVSSVLIGAQDWAGAWSNVNSGDGINIYGANSEEEMSLRFGVNVVMYALTGNYKADQVHLTHILERLGR